METNKTFIIAEVGSTHDGSLGNVKCAIEVAAECGADAVKLQTHIAEAETLHDAPMPHYFEGEPRFEYFQRTAFSRDEWIEIKSHAEKHGLTFLSSPFSVEAVELLESIGMEQYKIPSGEVTNIPYLKNIAKTGKPVILSSGMSSWSELDAAVETVKAHHDNLTVLQCTTEYPCVPEHVGLNVLQEMRNRWRLPVGLSDHTLSNVAALAAVTLGATVIEKHFTLSKRMYGSDAQHSAEPSQFADLVGQIREVEAMMHNRVDKSDVSRFTEMKKIFQKSIVTRIPIQKGEKITEEMLGIKKPGTGLPPSQIMEVIGRKIERSVPANTVLQSQDINWNNQ